jgi:hypothetical protein
MVVVGGIKPPRVTLNLPQSCFLELEHEMLLPIVPRSKQANISSGTFLQKAPMRQSLG